MPDPAEEAREWWERLAPEIADLLDPPKPPGGGALLSQVGHSRLFGRQDGDGVVLTLMRPGRPPVTSRLPDTTVADLRRPDKETDR